MSVLLGMSSKSALKWKWRLGGSHSGQGKPGGEGAFLEGAPVGKTLTFHDADQR